jgi:hypothetical protein
MGICGGAAAMSGSRREGTESAVAATLSKNPDESVQRLLNKSVEQGLTLSRS